MAYGDTYNKLRGIAAEPFIIQQVVKELTEQGYKVKLERSSLNEDMHDKVDAYLIFDKDTPYKGKTNVDIDVKEGRTLTVVTSKGDQTLQKSKADYVIFRVNGNLHWFEKLELHEYVKSNYHMIKPNKQGDGSKWICVVR